MTGPHLQMRVTAKRLALLRKVQEKDPLFRRRITIPQWIDQYTWARNNGLVKFDASGSLVLTTAGESVLKGKT